MMYKGSKRQKIWRHNSFQGHVAMAKANMTSIINSPTTTQSAKQTANQIYGLILKLREELKDRVDANPR